MHPALRRGLIGVGVAAVLGYGVPIAYLTANEKHIVFRPDQMGGRTVLPLPDSLHLASTPVSLTSGDGAHITGIVIPAADTAAPWLLYFHGNAGNITSSVLPQFYARWHALGVNIFAIDYRGFGASEARTPSEAGVYADAQAAYDYLRNTRKVPGEQIIIYGHSLGSGPATELALHANAAGLIIEGAFTSVADMGTRQYPWLPVRLFVTQRFANIDKIGQVAMPKLILHARDDAIVPYEMGQAMYEAAKAPKDWAELKGGHMHAFLVDSAHYWGHASAFVQRLRDGGPSGESPAPPVGESARPGAK